MMGEERHQKRQEQSHEVKRIQESEPSRNILGYSGKARWTFSARTWNTWLQVESDTWRTQLGPGFLSNNESVSGEALTHWEFWASKHVQPWRVSIWSLVLICLGGQQSELWCSPKSPSRVLFSKFLWDGVWGAVRGHTCPGPHPKSQNIPIRVFMVLQETQGVQRSWRYFCSHFWKWRLLWVGSMVSQVLWPLGFKSGLKSLAEFQDNAKTKGSLLLKKTKWWVGEKFCIYTTVTCWTFCEGASS